MNKSQFPKPWQPIRGSYHRSTPSRRGRFGPQDAGSTLEFTAAVQPAIIFAAYQIEQYAEQVTPEASGVAVLGSAYFSTLAIAVGLKVVVGVLKSYGASWLHDVGAWAWTRIIDSISVLFPGHSRRVRRRERWNERLDIDPNPPSRRQKLWQRWRNRRNRGDR